MRHSLLNTFIGTLVATAALLVVGLTASDTSPFSISVHPAFMRLGVDLDVRLGAMHLHATLSALDALESTNEGGKGF